MAKQTNREKILAEGLRVVHERGYAGASVRDIVQAAGVPQGSFTNHFASKEAFGLEILDIYFARGCQRIDATLRNDALSPLARLRAYLQQSTAKMCESGMRNGCLLGNFSAETADHSEVIRERLQQIFAETEAALVYCLEAAISAGEIDATLDCRQIAGFIVASLQGAILLAKAQRSLVPIERFEQILFSRVLV
jgi:TetR/AcrR family transcriptional repressor of nem operon